MNKKRIIIIPVLSIVSVIAIAVLSVAGITMSRYKKATTYLNSADYKPASDIFEKIPNYKNSTELYNYSYGMYCFENQKYMEATENLVKVKNYSDSQEIINKCAEALFKSEKYSDASKAYEETSFKKRGLYIQYSNGKEYALAGEYASAIGCFEKAKRILDSEQLVQDLSYKYAEKLYSEKNYTDAVIYYEKCNQTDEVKSKLVDSYYNIAEHNLEIGAYPEALTYYEKCGDYKDSKDKIKETYYFEAFQLLEDNDLSKASHAFYEIKEYKQSAAVCAWIAYKKAKSRDDYVETARKELKSRLRDPYSYIESSHYEDDGVDVSDDGKAVYYHNVVINYRAKNGFGGYVMDDYRKHYSTVLISSGDASKEDLEKVFRLNNASDVKNWALSK